ncbi:MAG: hypothetical protein U9R40_01410 [Synergistota bacterium]|nr:hypothetical protein [Synergistota bacterium]
MTKKLLLLCVAVMAAATAVAAGAADLQTLVDERSAVLYPEGQVLGDMVLGARAKMHFIYVDAELAEAARTGAAAPDWLEWHARHYGMDATRGKALFILRYEAFKPWDFVPEQITVNGRLLEPENVLTKRAFLPEGELPSGTVAAMAFAVPDSMIADSEEIVLGYDEYSVVLTPPGR